MSKGKKKRVQSQSTLNALKLAGMHRTKIRNYIEKKGVQTLEDMKALVKDHRMAARAQKELKQYPVEEETC